MEKSDLVAGFRYERLTLIDTLIHNGRTKWRCQCDCGNEVFARAKDILRLGYRSCGCFRNAHLKTHGMSSSREYSTWQAMLSRCHNQRNRKFKDYGGRGIAVCQTWRNSFEAFFTDLGLAPYGLTLDRVDPNKGYFKENCRWASLEQQANNRRSTRRFQGKTVREWSNELNVPYETMKKRLRRYGTPFILQKDPINLQSLVCAIV